MNPLDWLNGLWAVFVHNWETDGVWMLIGFGAQALFMSRFIVQWLHSEKQKKSVIPTAFWWISLAGGGSLFAYAVHRQELVFALGQILGLVVYVRNLTLIRGEKRRNAEG
ncbi:hypothetical protein VZ95_09350 [Elstera litoralis]|uniref:Lipid A biosynthesis N-terminal domain-containing protein n=1 Tax=Elstera litoralis TaxID=552518 RepID=A0A0F3IT22_9PROT|nr:lipid-A-disaccharide synthase N-terminal domain-containing protein [Elstera litoralis]KJV09772.1 hypothetical protein VZ95_09350 [Elstera litoralis]